MDSVDNPFLNTIRLPVKLSPFINKLVIVVHVLSLFLPWLSGLGFQEKLILFFFPLFSLAYYLIKFHFIDFEKQISELVLNTDDVWQIVMKEGRCYHASLGAVSFIHPLLTIITLSFNGTSKDFIFTPEIVDNDKLRRLRVRLKYSLDRKFGAHPYTDYKAD